MVCLSHRHPKRAGVPERAGPGDPDRISSSQHLQEAGTARCFPPPAAIAVAPATFNTVNKWAAGISDTLALGVLTEAIGKGLPIVALPFLNRAQAAHPAFQRSVDQLRSWGVRLLYGPDVLPLHEPGTGTQIAHRFPWQRILDELEQLTPAQAG